MVRLIAQNSAANTQGVRLRKLPAPREPNTVPEAPLPNAAPAVAPWPSTARASSA